MTFNWRVLPVFSAADVTQDLEQLKGLNLLLGETLPEGTVERKAGEKLEPSPSKNAFVNIQLQIVEAKPAVLAFFVGGKLVGNVGAGGAGLAVETFWSTFFYVPAGQKWEPKLEVGVAASFKLFSFYTFAN